MKTTPACSLLLLCLSACSPAPRPLARPAERPRLAPPDTAGTAYAEANARRVAAWEWAAGGGR